ncbi:hypothetical protein IU487_33635 [Nocardia puris]|uniref:hypothetical protein n=1 Tax=Nocardia puris TaxID=208602 RepID=UPI001893D725|nr:hypothetical protein [Nocardia puris]MBF6215943.1 hypothetical protein [Nocardia puris]
MIVSAHHPFAILAALLGHVDAFLFDAGSRLCHLASSCARTMFPPPYTTRQTACW